MEFGLLERHPEAFMCLGPLTSELQQEEQVLQRDEATPVPPCRQAKSACLRVVRHHGLQQAVTIGGRNAKLQRRSRAEESGQLCVELCHDRREVRIVFKRLLRRAQPVAFVEDRLSGLPTR
jgi:hypothetical protein